MSTDVKTIPQGTNGYESQTQEHRTAPNGVKLPIYMDNHATTPMDPRVLEEMLPYFMEKFGNAASRNHSFGWAGEEGVETARERVAKLVGPRPRKSSSLRARLRVTTWPSRVWPRCTRKRATTSSLR